MSAFQQISLTNRFPIIATSSKEYSISHKQSLFLSGISKAALDLCGCCLHGISFDILLILTTFIFESNLCLILIAYT